MGIVGAKEAIKSIAEKTKAFVPAFSDDISEFEPENLKKYDAVILNNTTGMFLGKTNGELKNLSESEKKKSVEKSEKLLRNFMRYVENGGGFLGIHGSADSYNYNPYKNADFAKMMNGHFVNHPWTINNDPVTIMIEDEKSPITKGIWKGKSFKITEEIYQLSKDFDRRSCRVLLALDVDKSPITTKNGKKAKIREDRDIALVFIKKFGKGRVAYFGFGHDARNYKDKGIMKFLMRLAQFACGDLKANVSSIEKPTAD